jgi:DNA-binding transcriptional MocR family regulator
MKRFLSAIPTAATALSRGSDTSLTEQLAARFADPIRQRLLSAGARLPSVRECARKHGVSASTVVAAYDQLLAQGLVEARKQRGFYVRETRSNSAAPLRQRDAAPAVQLPPLLPPPVSATALVRGMFQPPGSLPMPGLGSLPVDWLDLPLLSTALKRVTAGAQLGALSLQYGEPAGDMRLRRALAAQLHELGISAAPENIITTLGAIHALDVVTRSLLQAGDCVLVDEPGWPVEFARLAAMGLRVLPVPRGEAGPDLAVMQKHIDTNRANPPRLYITVSVMHNPTGASLSLAAAHRVLELAKRNQLHIVEDDTYAYLAPAHLPRLAALDALERTIYISGFSKILAPNWRVGFIAAPPDLTERFVDTKLLTTLTTPSITEQALAHCLENGLLRRHAERVMLRLDAARARAVKLAEAHGCTFAAPPRGLFGWVDVGIDTERLARAMSEAGWLLAPGSLFHATSRPTSLMRINYATTQEARFWKALSAARLALR